MCVLVYLLIYRVNEVEDDIPEVEAKTWSIVQCTCPLIYLAIILIILIKEKTEPLPPPEGMHTPQQPTLPIIFLRVFCRLYIN